MINSTFVERVCGEATQCDECPNASDARLDEMLDERFADHYAENLPPLYISGPMSGHEDFNFPAFNQVARHLRLLGFPVLNPADFGADPQYTWEQCIARDCLFLSYAKVIVLLPGWETSRGSRAEVEYAENLGIPAVTFECLTDKVLLRFLAPEDLLALAKLDQFREQFAAGVFESNGEIMIARRDKLELAVAIADRIARNVKASGPVPAPYGWDEDEDDDGDDDIHF